MQYACVEIKWCVRARRHWHPRRRRRRCGRTTDGGVSQRGGRDVERAAHSSAESGSGAVRRGAVLAGKARAMRAAQPVRAGVQTWQGPEWANDAAGMRPVPEQLWQGRAESLCRCGSEPERVAMRQVLLRHFRRARERTRCLRAPDRMPRDSKGLGMAGGSGVPCRPLAGAAARGRSYAERLPASRSTWPLAPICCAYWRRHAYLAAYSHAPWALAGGVEASTRCTACSA